MDNKLQSVIGFVACFALCLSLFNFFSRGSSSDIGANLNGQKFVFSDSMINISYGGWTDYKDEIYINPQFDAVYINSSGKAVIFGEEYDLYSDEFREYVEKTGNIYLTPPFHAAKYSGGTAVINQNGEFSVRSLGDLWYFEKDEFTDDWWLWDCPNGVQSNCTGMKKELICIIVQK